MKIINVILLCMVFCYSVSAENDVEIDIEISPDDISFANLCKHSYTDSEIHDIIEYNGTLLDFCTEHDLECVRKKGAEYYLYFMGENTVGMLSFDRDGKKSSGKVYSAELSKSDFDCLDIGQPLSTVKKLDPNGDYLWFFVNDLSPLNEPIYSMHCTKDGYFVKIGYVLLNHEFKIKYINYETI